MKKLLIGSTLGLLAVMGSFSFANADVIAQQVSDSSYHTDYLSYPAPNNQLPWQQLPTGLTGTPYIVSFYAQRSAGANADITVTIQGNNGQSQTGGACGSPQIIYRGYVTLTDTNKTLVTITNATTTNAFDPSCYYTMVFASAQNTTRYYGSTTDLYTGGDYLCFAPTNCAPADTSSMKDLYFSLDSGYIVPLLPQVYSITTPTQFQVTPSSNVPVIFTYLNTSTYDSVAVQIIDQSNNGLTLVTGSQQAQINTTATYSTVLALTANHAYKIRGELYSAAGNATPVFGPYVDFSTVSDQFFSATSSLTSIAQVNESNASTTISNAPVFFSNLISVFGDRVPWCYAWSIRDIYNTVATSSATYGGISIDWQSLPVATGTRNFLPQRTDLFSTTTVGVYLHGAALDTFNALASAAFLLGTLYAVYRKALAVGFLV